uniref:IPT/TIG domain-containing protein n=1 Tax=Sinocyclocheilus rhinocerous TaxID=307959 RepID=A0A673N446_9TELE
MNLHQVLTGAVNPGENCFSVGSVNNQPFTAYASGCDIVILGSDFERIQIIPGAKHGNIQVGCQVSIAASYGNIICVFEPVEVSPQGKAQNVSFFWNKYTLLKRSAAPTHFIKFSPDGEFFATAGQVCVCSYMTYAHYSKSFDCFV